MTPEERAEHVANCWFGKGWPEHTTLKNQVLAQLQDAITAEKARPQSALGQCREALKQGVEVEYLEKGTFQGGDEDCSLAKIKPGDEYLVFKKSALAQTSELGKRASRERELMDAVCEAAAEAADGPYSQMAWAKMKDALSALEAFRKGDGG